MLKEIVQLHSDSCSLGFRFKFADENFIETLKEIINDENLTINYTIKRELDNVYIEWK